MEKLRYKLRYKCNDKGPFFAESSVEVDCRLYMGEKRMGPFVVRIEPDPYIGNPFNFSIEVKPKGNLEENLDKADIGEGEFEDVIVSEFEGISDVIVTALKNKEGVVEIDYSKLARDDRD